MLTGMCVCITVSAVGVCACRSALLSSRGVLSSWVTGSSRCQQHMRCVWGGGGPHKGTAVRVCACMLGGRALLVLLLPTCRP